MKGIAVYICMLTSTLCLGDLPNTDYYFGTFPEKFVWGAGTSATQIEGATRTDGRTPSVWDIYSHTPGKTDYGDTPDIAADSYHNYMDDIKMLQNLGVNSYHMSFSWSRLMLNRTTLNPAGVEYYRKIFMTLKNSNIDPYVTLYYYDLPEELERNGGWLNEAIINDFKTYARQCFDTFGSLVKFWITMHDPKGVAWNGYGEGTAAPGRWEPGWNPYIAGNNLLRAHREVQDLYISSFKTTQHGQLGISLTTNVYQPMDEWDEEAAQRASEFDLGWFAEPLFGNGHYPNDMVRQVMDKSIEYGVSTRLPSIEDHLKTTSDVDFLVLTVDTAYNVTNEKLPSDPPNYSYDQDVRKIKLDTLPQDSVRKLLNVTKQKYVHVKGVYVTGGIATENATLKDQLRINYFKWHIDQVLKAQSLDKCNILGYVARPLMDSFEWSRGYSLKGGLFSVDFSYSARSRTPRASSRHYAQIVKENGILPGYSGRGGIASGFVPYEDHSEVLYGTFPGDFAWATATAAHQVEGAWNVDEKGPSIWDTLTHNTNIIKGNTTGDVACDSYHKYKEDVQMLKELNVTYYRLSIAWSRVLPKGTLDGGINKKGINYYHRVFDELLKYGIKPMVTLYHFDLPQALEDKGGWLNESVVQWFRDYADLCFNSYGSNVSMWITFNDPPIFAVRGYGEGIVAPQKKDPSKNQYIAAKNIIRAHAEAYHLYNTTYKPTQKGKVGISISSRYSEPRDPYNVEDVEAAERASEFYTGMFAEPIYGSGDFPAVLKYQVEKKNNETNWKEQRLPKFTKEEIQRNTGTYDFFGLNVNTGTIAHNDPQPASVPPTYDNDQDAKIVEDPAWHGATPWVIRKMLNRIKYRYNNVDVYITENGVGDRNGTLKDEHRINYYRLYISEVLKAIKLDGCNVKSYTTWSLMDSFEWLQGFTLKFGLYQVNFEDPEKTRTPKTSAYWYRDVIEDNGFKPGTTRPGGRGTAVQMEREFYYGTFPDDFAWSAASSSFQVEGAIHKGNRGESIWDNFPVLNGDTGHVACDSYDKYEEDVRLLKNMGVNHYRFSIAWSRIFPDGTKASKNQEGIDYYHRLLDALYAAGIEPMVTLYHWDLPKALQDKGGWTNLTIIDHFKDYADVCFKEYGKKVKLWITFNEPWVFTVKGLESGDMAPGHNTNRGVECYMAAHTVLQAHAVAYHLYNDTYRQQQPDGKISITLNIDWAEPRDPMNPSDIEASEWAIQMFLGWFAHPVYVNGDYPDVMKERIANVSQAQGLNVSRLPEFTDEQKKRIQGTHDFFGMNHYTTKFVFKQDSFAGDSPPNYFNDRGIAEATDPNWLPSGSSWLYVVPWGVRKILNWVRNNYGEVPIYITENGLSDNNGTLNDQHRIHFYRYYINEVLKAITFDKVDVRGYTAWALLDNFEWDRGYSERFGTHFVNFSDPNRPRTPKASAGFLRHIFQDNGFKPDAITDPKRKPIPFEDERLLGEFPEDFVWGAATSAYQIEGGYDREGRGLSSWDVFSHTPGHVYQNQTGDEAAMSYTHYLGDVAALRDMGAKAYHFSLSWSRILPNGTSDVVNQAGIDYYNDLIMALIDEEIQPIVSLHQWDTPAALTDGWLDSRVVEAFGNYSRICFNMFGNKVKTWITLNEPNTLALYGYELGQHAPGVKDRGYEAAHNMIRAHASAYKIYKSEFKQQNGKIGLAVETTWAIPKTNRDPGDWSAQDRKFAFDFDWFTDPVFKDGDYPDVMKKEVELRNRAQHLNASRLPEFTDDEKKMVKGSADFLGMSYYTTNLVEELRHTNKSKPGIVDDCSATVSANDSLKSTNSPWLHIYPKGIRMVLRRAKERYGNIPIYVTGNGVSDEPGTIKDDVRIDYIKSHANEVLKAMVIDGVNVLGYMAYSLIDCFEWDDGYRVGFGLYSINFTDPQRQRHDKDSSVFYRDLIRDNGFFAHVYMIPQTTAPPVPTPTPKIIIKKECPPPTSETPLINGHVTLIVCLAAVVCFFTQ